MAAQVVTEADGQPYAPWLIEGHAGVIRVIREAEPNLSADLGTLWQRLGSERGPVAGRQVMIGIRHAKAKSPVGLPPLTIWQCEPGMQVVGRDKGKARY